MKLDAFGYARLFAIALILLPLVIRYGYDSHLAFFHGGYFILLRWIVCPVLAMTAYRAYKLHYPTWMRIFGIDAALFNPLFIVRLGTLWQFVDGVTLILILVSFFTKFGRNP